MGQPLKPTASDAKQVNSPPINGQDPTRWRWFFLSIYLLENVGKSSLVAALVKEMFVPQVFFSLPYQKLQHVLPEVTIPSDWSADQVPIHIVDSSSNHCHLSKVIWIIDSN